MKRVSLSTSATLSLTLPLTLSLCALVACSAPQDPEPGPASSTPKAATGNSAGAAGSGFTLTDLNGAEVSLASYKGKTVILEWFNPGCPFIVHAHSEGPLKDQAARVTAKGDVAWLAINSSAKGKGADLEFNKSSAAGWNIPHPVLMDPTGEVGRNFGAKTTPHMFILDGAGEVVYKGALDNAPRGQNDGEYVNYIDAALADIAAGRPVAMAETKSYGCSVKY